MSQANPSNNLDVRIAEAWQAQLAQPGLTTLLQTQGQRLFDRFATAYRDLFRRSRQQRRGLLRKLGMTAAGAALALALYGAAPLQAASIPVDNTTCTLIDAITAANTDTAVGGCAAGSGADTITLNGNVLLTAVNNNGTGLPYFATDNTPTGLPIISSVITIEGNGATISRDASAPNFRIFDVSPTGNLTLNNATVTGGKTLSEFTGDENGGAIYIAAGVVIVNNCTFSGNTSSLGGAIAVVGSPTNVGTLTINNSTFSGNTAAVAGGAVATFSYTNLFLQNATIVGNLAFQGGGLGIGGSATILNSIISGNSGGDFTAQEIVLSGYAPLTTAYNVFGESSKSNAAAFPPFGFTPSASDRIATSDGTHPTALNAILDPTLANNGGSTWTHALVAGSPALDASPNGLATDQRGVARPQGAAFDIGAFELAVAAPTATPTNTAVPPTATPTNTATPTDTPVPPTATPTNTAVPPTATPTNTAVPPTATPTNTATPTDTPVPPTATPTNTPDPPTATATNTPVPPTATATSTSVPPTATATFTPSPSPTATPAPLASCGGFAVFESAPGVFTAPGFSGTVIVGGNGYDFLVGSSGPNLILGLGGPDDILGGPGNDIICGGPGVDIILGNNGVDTLYGEDDPDWLIGGNGEDLLYGGDGWDDLEGNHGRDTIDGGDGYDVLLGDHGEDTLLGEAGPDDLYGGHGNDDLNGGDGPDFCKGGPGSDSFANCEWVIPAAADAANEASDDTALTAAAIEVARTANDGENGEHAIGRRIWNFFLPLVGK